MIVVAIIGITAAIATSQYQDYIMRTRWADNFQSVAQLKLAIADCVQTQVGSFSTPHDCGTAAGLLAGGYVPVGYTLPTPNYGSQVALLSGSGVLRIVGTARAGGCTVEIEPSLTQDRISWSYVNAAGGCGRAKTGVGT
jgi:type IV pilus assembly protein PilA